jgi:hypothetical protein
LVVELHVWGEEELKGRKGLLSFSGWKHKTIVFCRVGHAKCVEGLHTWQKTVLRKPIAETLAMVV